MREKLLFILTVSLLLTCCTKEGETIYKPNPEEEQPATTPLVTVIYGPNGLGDRSYNDLVYKGVEAAAQKYGVRTLQLSPESNEQGFAYLETIFQQMESATDTVRRLFISPSPLFEEYIRKNNRRLEKNPYADLLFLETTTPFEGKGSTLYIDYYGAMYMGGCIVRYFEEDQTTLLLANPHTQTVVEAGEGFVEGFNDTPQIRSHEMKVHLRYLSDEPGGGFTMPDTTAMRIYHEEKAMLPSKYGNLILVPICGGSMHTFMRAIRSVFLNGDCYVGIDGDFKVDSDNCVFSIVKHVDSVMEDCIGQWLDGSLPKHQSLGLADGASGIITENSKHRSDIKKINIDSLYQVAIGKEAAHANR